MSPADAIDVNSYLRHLDRLLRRGRDVRAGLAADPADRAATAEVRLWQQDCATLVNQLSGGAKAHWLSRAFSEALLVRSNDGRVVLEADLVHIVDRILEVLRRAVEGLSSMTPAAVATHGHGAADETHSAGHPVQAAHVGLDRRFDFVNDTRLRAVLAQAFAGSRDASDAGDFREALVLSCSVLEAIITDALTHRAGDAGSGAERADDGAPDVPIADWSFDARIAAAERAGLIHGGCARLPPVARSYRNLTDAEGRLRPEVMVSPRDAQLVRQVLAVVLRDLDPGR
jgi:hypothetical protein